MKNEKNIFIYKPYLIVLKKSNFKKLIYNKKN